MPSAGGQAEPLLQRPGLQYPNSWSPDGRFLIFEENPDTTVGSRHDIWLLPVGEAPRRLTATPFNERGGVVSANGRWLAFVSDESGRDEVYLQPFPGPGAKTPISNNGGLQPVWSRDGRELLYREGDALMSVPIQPEPLRVGVPVKLFDLPGVVYNLDRFLADYDVAPDGRFLAVAREAVSVDLHVVLNWSEELRRPLGR